MHKWVMIQTLLLSIRPIRIYWGGNNGYVYKSSKLPVDLKPEKTGSFEMGVDVRFFGDRLGLDFSYYNSNTTNQLISIPCPLASGYQNRFINAGKVQNKGVEIKLYGTPDRNKKLLLDYSIQLQQEY